MFSPGDAPVKVLPFSGRPNAPPATQNVSQKSNNNTEVRRTEFTFLFQGKISELNRLHSQTNVVMFMSKTL